MAFISPLAVAQATLNLSQDLVTLGIAQTNLIPNQPSLDAAPLLQSGVAYASAHQIGTVIADPGSYYFLSINCNTHAAFGSVNNMTIDFQGANLIFTHPLYYGIVVYPSTNLTLQNFTVDYQPLPFTQVQVAAVDVPNNAIQFSVPAGWQDPSVFNNQPIACGDGPPSVEMHVFRNGRPAFGTGRMLTQLPITGNRFPVMGFTAPSTISAVRPGDIVVLAMRTGSGGIAVSHCSMCTLRNITVYSCSCGGAGVAAIAGKSITMERVYAIPKPGTDRLVSVTSAAFIGVAGPNNQIRLSRGIRTMDDAFWFFGRSIGTVHAQLTARSLVIEADTAWTFLGDGDTVPNGSPVTFQRLSDGVILGSAIIQSQTSASGAPPQVTFTFDRDVPANVAGAIMYTTDPNQNGSNTVFERNTAQNQSSNGSGVLVTGLANTTVRSNYFQRRAYSAIYGVQSMASGNPPNAPVVNLSVVHNVIDGTKMTTDWLWFELGAIQMTTLTSSLDLMTTSPHSNINVTNNFIEDSGRAGVWIGNTAGGNVSGNYLLHDAERPEFASTYASYQPHTPQPIEIDATSSGILQSSNTIDRASGRMFVTDNQYRELAAYLPGATIRLNAYGLGTLSSPSVSLTDADGVTTSVQIQNTATHALDVTLPSGSALGGAYVTLVAGGAKYFGTLFIDSQDSIPSVNGCTYESSLSSTSAPSAAGTVPILVITQAGCAYQIAASDPFVTGANGIGTGVVSVGFAVNNGLSRNATIEIAGQPVTLVQASVIAPVSLTPSSGVGMSQEFAADYSDTNGVADINAAMMSINKSSSLVNGCVIEYIRGANQLFLMNNAGTAWLGPGTPGSPGTLQNSQCTLDLQGSSTNSSTNHLTVNFALSFTSSFMGLQTTFMNLSNNASLSPGWQAMGTWDVDIKRRKGQLTSQ
jgi:hypothetical protein